MTTLTLPSDDSQVAIQKSCKSLAKPGMVRQFLMEDSYIWADICHQTNSQHKNGGEFLK
jgi:hypothetical protein